jgi:hypothetical protein
MICCHATFCAEFQVVSGDFARHLDVCCDDFPCSSGPRGKILAVEVGIAMNIQSSNGSDVRIENIWEEW